MAEVAEYGEFSFSRMLGRAAYHLAEHGPAVTARSAIWRLEYERLQRRKRRYARHAGPMLSAVNFRGKEFELHPSMAGLSEELCLFGVHEPLATRFYLERLSPGDHVLDVGSNIGYYLLTALDAVGPSGRLVGFEPAPDVYEILQRNIRRSGSSNIEVFPWAIGAKNELSQFHQSEVPNWGSLIHNESLLPTESVDVQVRRIDDLLAGFPGFHPTVLRMDVEGGELMVLDGAKETLRAYRPCLFIEIHTFAVGWEWVRSTLLNLRQLGYSSGVVIERSWDQPWISKWARKRRCWTGTIDHLLRRMESPKDALTDRTFGLILTRPGA